MSQKRAEELTDEEAIRELFPKRVVKEARREIEKADKRAEKAEKKPAKSAGSE